GPDLQYQWRKNTVNITGATSSSLELKSIKAADFGDYDVVVKNSCGADTSASARLTVNAPGSGPALVFTISPVDFHGVHVGSPVEQNFDGLIRNAGDDTLKVTGMSISGSAASEFAIVSGGAPFNLPPNSSRPVKLRFTPATTGLRTAQIDFTSNAKDNPSLTLQGTGSLFGITTTTPNVVFGQTTVGSAHDTVIQICNTSTAAETISAVSLQGDPQFSLVPAVITPLTMAPDSCLTISVRYSPTAPGNATGTLVIKNAQGDSIQISLSGSTPGIVSAPRDAASPIFSTGVVPNPTSDQATISVNLVRTVQIDLLVVDERGSVVRRFSRAHAAAGPNTFHWDGKAENGARVPSGAYQVVITAGGSVNTLSLVMTR
ncbi:MAG: choice-of-anchor D domain-containing protein, partial [Candidatus Kapaibacterium sp.]